MFASLLSPLGYAPLWADVAPEVPADGAAPGPKKPLLENTEFLLAVGLMALVLFGGAAVLSYINRRRQRLEASTQDSTSQLELYREMYESGELTESEYRKVRDRLAGRMKKEIGLPISERKPPDPDAPPPTGPQTL